MSKRLFDLLLALLALFLLSPVFLLITGLVIWKLGSPALFQQKRPGLHGKLFTIYKFRTMTDDKSENGQLLPDHMRLTRFGRILRRTSLDELPELWNVLMSDMSLVGPRPLLVEYLDLYTPQQMQRHHVRPGITGWAQINGRNALTWEEKFKLDIWYVDNQSFWLDIQILLRTISKTITQENISHEGEATMKKFKGESD